MKKLIAFAHRGASSLAPENTLSAFKRAIEFNVDGIEFDVHLTKDGIPVIIHDETVDRTSNGKGFVHTMTLEELRVHDFGIWFSKNFVNEKIPTLEEVFQLSKNWSCLINIELKNNVIEYQGLEEKVIELILRYNLLDRVIISSFNHKSLERVKCLLPEVKIGLLYDHGHYASDSYAVEKSAYSVHPDYNDVNNDFVQRFKNTTIKIFPYTVDSPTDISNMSIAGVDGFFTNIPDKAIDQITKILR